MRARVHFIAIEHNGSRSHDLLKRERESERERFSLTPTPLLTIPLQIKPKQINLGLELKAYTATARIAAMNAHGRAKVETATALDLRNGAYLVAYATPAPKHSYRNGNGDGGSNGGGSSENSTLMCVQRTFASRSQKHVVVSSFECSNDGLFPAVFTLGQQSLDGPVPNAKTSSVASCLPGVSCSRTVADVSETSGTQAVAVGECHDDSPLGIPQVVHPGETSTIYLISSRCSTADYGVVDSKADDDVVARARKEYASARANATQLWGWHTAAMAALLLPGVGIDGNPALAAAVNASAAALLNAVRHDVYYSSSPEGLIGGRYNGHVFWDTESWQLPYWQTFYPPIARAVLKYRGDRMDAAATNAKLKYNLYGKNFSFKGLKFPWESAFVGVEQCAGNTEDHLQGDVALAFLKHWWADKEDPEWLRETGFPVIEGLATYYASRATRNPDATYSIARTMPPDEYHSNVTDSVYGNTVARLTLQAAYSLAPFAGVTPNSTFAAIAGRLRIEYDAELDYHPEYAGWTPKQRSGTASNVKQADAVLLGYPLEVAMRNSTRRHDLKIYSNVTDPQGPAMSWSIFSIGYGDLGDDGAAASYFARGYQELQTGPFLLWHEQAVSDGRPSSQGAPNFITGAGGMLQALVAGYGGFRVRNGTLNLVRPRLPSNTTGFHLRQASWQGNLINVDVDRDGWEISIDVATSSASPTLGIALIAPGGGTPAPLAPLAPLPPLSRAPLRFASGASASIFIIQRY